MNFFGKRRQPGPQRAPEPRKETKEEIEARAKLLELSIRAKQLENWANLRCLKACCKLDQDLLDETESQCLDNCQVKFNKFLTLVKDVQTKSDS